MIILIIHIINLVTLEFDDPSYISLQGSKGQLVEGKVYVEDCGVRVRVRVRQSQSCCCEVAQMRPRAFLHYPLSRWDTRRRMSVQRVRQNSMDLVPVPLSIDTQVQRSPWRRGDEHGLHSGHAGHVPLRQGTVRRIHSLSSTVTF